jgi:zinc/manganese transport system substrate-binding protein
MHWLKAVLALALSALAAGCGASGEATSLPEAACRPLHVVASTSILGDVLASLVGEQGVVEVLMPRGVDPHAFQVSARQATAMRRADLVVVNGLGLEEGMGGAVEAAAADGVRVVEAGSFVEPLPVALGYGEDDPGHGSLDPHIWTDPARMAQVVTGLGEALTAADPACPQRWRDAAEAYREELLALDEEIEAILEAIPADRRKLITNHHALGYFADRYGFIILGAVIPGGSTLAEPSPADLADLVRTLEREGVRAIFAETTRPADLAEALAAELGGEVAVVELFTGSLGEPGSGAETYPAMQRTNARRIAAALGDG